MTKDLLRGFPLLILLIFSFSPITAQTIDDTFKPLLGGQAKIYASARQADAKLLVAGDIVIAGSVVRRGIARFNTDGTVDQSFNAGNLIGGIRTITLQPDGKILIAGFMTKINGTDIPNGFARLLANGALDPDFDATASFTGYVDAMIILPDNKIMLGGFNLSGGTQRGLIKLNENGSLDQTFNTQAVTSSYSWVNKNSFALQADQKLLVGGQFRTVNGATKNYFFRMNTDGSVDNTFQTGTGPDGPVNEILVQPDGKIVLGGSFANYNNVACKSVIRLEANGTLDNTFTSAISSSQFISEIVMQNDGKFIVGGEFSSPHSGICRLNANGTHDNTFAPGTAFAGLEPYAITTLADGTLLIGGDFSQYNGTIKNGLVNVTSTGSIVAKDFHVGGNATVNAVYVQPDGKILIGGDFLFVNGTYQRYLARLNSDGTRDATLVTGTGPSGEVFAIARQTDGNYLIGGGFSNYNGLSNSTGIVRIDASGTRDATLTGLESYFQGDGARTILIQDNGYIVLGGRFRGRNGILRHNLLRISPTGVLDNTFNPDNHLPKSFMVTALAKLDNSSLLVSGPPYNGNIYYEKFTNGLPDNTFYKLPISYTETIQKWDDKFIFAGYKGIEAVNTDGTPNSSFAPAQNDFHTIAVLPFNNRLITGGKNRSSQVDTHTLTFYNADGTVDNALSKTISGRVTKIIPDNNGNLLISGLMNTIDGQGVGPLVRLLVDTPPAAPSALAAPPDGPTKVNLSWTDNSTTETSFEIERSVGSNANFVRIATVAANTASFTDTDINGSTSYYYRVRAVNLGGNSNYTQEANATTSANTFPAPASIEVEMLSEIQFKVVWNRTNGAETGYEIYGSTDGNKTFSRLSTQIKNDTTFHVYGSKFNTTYHYKVRAVYGTSFSNYTSAVIATTGSNPLGTPTNFNVVSTNFGQIRVSWGDTSSVETGYKLFRSKNAFEFNSGITSGGNGGFVEYKSLPAGTREFYDSDLIPGGWYSYYVVAVNNTGKSSGTSVKSAITPAYMSGAWVQKNNFEGPARRGAVTFVIGTKAYVGTGLNGSTRYKDLWEYNPDTDDWVQKADLPGAARFGAIGFSINGKGYIGLGNAVAGGPFNRDLYEYDPGTNAWTQKADFPADPSSDGGRTSSSVFVLEGKAYVVFGNNGVNNPRTVYAYDPIANTWTQRADFPGNGRMSGVAFTINGRAYAGYGTALNKYNDLYEYLPATDSWVNRTSWNAAGGRAGATLVAPGIMISGDNATNFTESTTREVYQYIPDINAWQKWSDFNGVKRAGGIGFRIGGKIFFGTGSDGSTYMQDMWVYNTSAVMPPATPKTISAVFQSPSSVNLSWQVGDESATALVLERSTQPENGFAEIATLTPEASNYHDSGVSASMYYYYRLKAVNPDGQSGWSNAKVYTSPPPSIPSNLVLTAMSGSEIKLTWEETTGAATNFSIYRSDYPVSQVYTKIHETSSRVLTFTDTNLSADKEYGYYVIASHPAATSTRSEIATGYTYPLAPVLTAGAVTYNSIDIRWSGTHRQASMIEVFRSSDNVNFTLFVTREAVFPSTTLSASPDLMSYIKVRVKNPTGYSAFSNVVSVLTPPAVPSGFAATALSETEIKLTWNKSANPLTIYRIQIWDGTLLHEVFTDPDVNTLTRIELNPDREYIFSIRAMNSAGVSGFSQNISAYTKSLPPSNLVATELNENVVLTWNDPSINEFSFMVERSVGNDQNFEKISEVAANQTTYTDELVVPATTYFYRTRVSTPAGESAYSNTVTITTKQKNGSDGVVGIEDDTFPGLNVYPNPVNQYLTVEFNDEESEYEIMFTDLQGRQIDSRQSLPGNTKVLLDVSRFASGQYILLIRSGNRTQAKLIHKK